MKLAIRLLLLIIVFVFLIATKISYFQKDNRNIFKNVTHAGYVDQAWSGVLQKLKLNFESASTITTTTCVTKTFDNVTKNKLNNIDSYETPAKNLTPNIDKITPPKLQQIIPSVYIYTAHREVCHIFYWYFLCTNLNPISHRKRIGTLWNCFASPIPPYWPPCSILLAPLSMVSKPRCHSFLS